MVKLMKDIYGDSMNRTHKMHIKHIYFEKIKNGEKTIEVRCNDQKRRLIQIGDFICFNDLDFPNNTITVQIINIFHFSTFRELYSSFDIKKFGLCSKSLENMVYEMNSIYPPEKEKKYGVLGIEIHLNKDYPNIHTCTGYNN